MQFFARKTGQNGYWKIFNYSDKKCTSSLKIYCINVIKIHECDAIHCSIMCIKLGYNQRIRLGSNTQATRSSHWCC